MDLNKIITSQKLEQILLNFIDVLRINILMVDTQGNVVLAPKTTGYGWSWAGKFGVFQHLGTPQFLTDFQNEGHYLKSVDAIGLQSFAIPVVLKADNTTIGYLIVGPVILNRRLEQAEYQAMVKEPGLDFSEFLESLNEIRIVTFNTLKSILDLLFELSQYALRINIENKEERTIFKSLLDLSMALTHAECGSIMLFNKETKELSILVYRGQNPEKYSHVRVKMGEGIAGLAAQKKESFVINEDQSNNRIRHLLKKPELKCALVLPIININNEVLGVMNLSTHQGDSRLAANSQQMLKSLTEITARTVNNF